MTEEVRRYVWALIGCHGSHDGGMPVSFSPLPPLFAPIDRDMTETHVSRFTLLSLEGHGGQFVLENTLLPNDQRLVYAHGVGHLINQDPGFLR